MRERRLRYTQNPQRLHGAQFGAKSLAERREFLQVNFGGHYQFWLPPSYRFQNTRFVLVTNPLVTVRRTRQVQGNHMGIAAVEQLRTILRPTVRRNRLTADYENGARARYGFIPIANA